MKGYKIFEKGLICNPTGEKPFQYKENTTFEQGEDAIICAKGFHFCKRPLDVLNYYPLIDNEGKIAEFAEVEALEKPVTDDNIKFVTKKIRIGNKINLEDLINADIIFSYERKRLSDEKIISNEPYKKILLNDGFTTLISKGENTTINVDNIYQRIVSSGLYAQINSEGNKSQIISKGQAAKITTFGTLTSIISKGVCARITSFGSGAKIFSNGSCTEIVSKGNNTIIASSGSYTLITSMENCAQIISSGDNARISVSGDFTKIKSEGKNSIIYCSGLDCMVSAKEGSWITFANRKNIDVKTIRVDGVTIKEDTFYKFVDGNFVEV